MGDVIAWRHLIWALTTAMVHDPVSGPGRSLIPSLENAGTLRLFATECWPAVRKIFEKFLGGSLIVTPSSYQDLLSPELRPLLDKYYRGSSSDAEERIKLFKLIWDAIGTEFGARHELYEINYAGNFEQVRLDLMNFSRRSGLMDQFTGLADQCLSDYDLHGWKDPTWSFDPAQ